MVRINSTDEVDITIHSKYVTEVSTIYNNKFVKRLYVGMTYAQAREKFIEELKKGEHL